MRISDIVSSMDLATYPQVALIIFLSVFAVVSWRTFRRKHTQEFADAAKLPLEDAPTPPNR